MNMLLSGFSLGDLFGLRWLYGMVFLFNGDWFIIDDIIGY